MELKTVDLSKGQFECGKETFYIAKTLSFNRWTLLQEYDLELGFLKTGFDIYKGVRSAYDALNNRKDADAAVALHNIMQGRDDQVRRGDAALRICTLFINRKGEDLTEADEGKLKEKIDIWAKELDVTPFFHFALSVLPHWVATLNDYTQSISGAEKRK